MLSQTQTLSGKGSTSEQDDNPTIHIYATISLHLVEAKYFLILGDHLSIIDEGDHLFAWAEHRKRHEEGEH